MASRMSLSRWRNGPSILPEKLDLCMNASKAVPQLNQFGEAPAEVPGSERAQVASMSHETL